MRLRVFAAATLKEAMAALRRELGDEAVILATEEGADGIRVTAALDTAEDDLGSILETATPAAVLERLALALRFHGAGGRRIERLCLTARDSGEALPEKALAFALAEHCRFAPIETAAPGPLVLAGAPGAGKTLMTARLAAAACLRGEPPRVATTDSERRGGVAQLESLLEVMGVALEPVERLAGASAPILVDTAAGNPLRPDSQAASAALARRLGGELVPVLAADTAAAEAHDQARAWRALGARRFLVARVDAVRRLGMLLAAADAGLAFAGVAIAPVVGEPVKPLTAANLARLLLHRAMPAMSGEGRP